MASFMVGWCRSVEESLVEVGAYDDTQAAEHCDFVYCSVMQAAIYDLAMVGLRCVCSP